MAKIIIGQKEANVKDNEGFIDELEERGVPFGYQDGKCGTGLLSVVEGMKKRLIYIQSLIKDWAAKW